MKNENNLSKKDVAFSIKKNINKINKLIEDDNYTEDKYQIALAINNLALAILSNKK